MENLEDRIGLFNRLELPGQPAMMHMGTHQLVHDLWSEVLRLRSIAGAVSPGPSFSDLREQARANPVLKAFDGA